MKKSALLLATGLGLSFSCYAADYPLKIINHANINEDTYLTVVDQNNIYTVNSDGSLTKGPLASEAYFQDYAKDIGTKDFTLKIPDNFTSGRVYISEGYPLGGLATNPSFYSKSKTDENYYMSQIVYDKVELTWKDGTLFINPSSVDFFGIPLTLQNPAPIKATDLAVSGYPLGMSWLQIMSQIEANMPAGVYKTHSNTWNNLLYKNSTGNIIRAVSPTGIATSVGENSPLGSKKNIADDPTITDSSYLVDNQPKTSTSYLNNLIDFYKDPSKNQLAFDVSQLYNSKEDSTEIFKNVAYFADGIAQNSQCSRKFDSYDDGKPVYKAYANSNDCWKFIPKVCSDVNNLSTCTTPTKDQATLQNEYIPLDYVSSFSFFSPGQWPFDNNNVLPEKYTKDTIQDNHPAKGLIAQDLTALFSAGLLPVGNTQLSNMAISQKSLSNFIKNNPSILYQQNSANGTIATMGPWFNQYAKVIHSICFDKNTKQSCTSSTAPADKEFPVVYTFAFDDFLSQDGTLTSNNTSNPITITINDMTGSPITNPGPAPRPDFSLKTPIVLSGEFSDQCKSEDTCTISATFKTKNTPNEMQNYEVEVTPLSSSENGDNCQLTSQMDGVNKWTACGGVASQDVKKSTITYPSNPDSDGYYHYQVTSEIPRNLFERVATGAAWKNCKGSPISSTKNKFKYHVLISDGKNTPVGADSPNTSTYPNVTGCATPNL